MCLNSTLLPICFLACRAIHSIQFQQVAFALQFLISLFDVVAIYEELSLSIQLAIFSKYMWNSCGEPLGNPSIELSSHNDLIEERASEEGA